METAVDLACVAPTVPELPAIGDPQGMFATMSNVLLDLQALYCGLVQENADLRRELADLRAGLGIQLRIQGGLVFELVPRAQPGPLADSFLLDQAGP